MAEKPKQSGLISLTLTSTVPSTTVFRSVAIWLVKFRLLQCCKRELIRTSALSVSAECSLLGNLTLSRQKKQPVSVRITKMAHKGGVVPECLALAVVQAQAIRSPGTESWFLLARHALLAEKLSFKLSNATSTLRRNSALSTIRSK